MRKIDSTLIKIIIKVFTIVHSCFIIYTSFFGNLFSGIQRPLHLMLLLPLGFLLYPANKNSPQNNPSLLDYALSILSFFVCFYILIQCRRLMFRWQFVDPICFKDKIFGIIAIILVIEATRRIVAPLMAVLAVVTLSYLSLGNYFPGDLRIKSFSLDKLIDICYLGPDIESIFGALLGVTAGVISLYILFGAIINKTKVSEYFNSLSEAIMGQGIGGPAKVSVFSSGLFGMVSGSGTSNVFVTGTYTIPAMKKVGFTPEFSAAIEACASTGGQYMPPVMGAAAFIMAQIVGIPYGDVVKAAIISALLYYYTLYILVDFRIKKYGFRLKNNLNEKRPNWKSILSNSYLLSPIFVIFIMLLKGYTPLLAGVWAIIVTVIIGFITHDIDFKKIFEALEDGAKNTIMVAVAVACAGIVIGGITHTGLGLFFLSTVLSLSKGKLIIALFLVAIAVIIFGMGLPTSAAYIMAATLAVPALLKFDVNILAAHLFVFYFAINAPLTPPVAICSYAAASIAHSDPYKTGIEAFKLAIAGFIVPFAFVYNNSLIKIGSFWEIVYSIFFAIIGLWFIAKGISGYVLARNNNYLNHYIQRSLIFQNIIRLILIIFGIFVIFIPYLYALR